LEFIYSGNLTLPLDILRVHKILQYCGIYFLSLDPHVILPRFKHMRNYSFFNLMNFAEDEKANFWKNIGDMFQGPCDSKEKSDNFCDVVLLVEDKRFECHKAILMSRSSFFYSLLKWNWKESNQKEIVINEMGADVAELVLHFIYNNTLEISSSVSAMELYKVAQFFGIHEMLLQCETFLIENVDSESVCEVWNEAVQLQAENLMENCKTYFINYFSDCTKSSGFLRLEKSLLKLALNTGEISEDWDEVFEPVMAWCKHTAANTAEANVQNIAFELLPPQTIFNREIKDFLLNGNSQKLIFGFLGGM